MGLGVLTGDRKAFFEGLRKNMKTPPNGKAKRVENPMDGLFSQRETSSEERKVLRERFINEWNTLGGQAFSIQNQNELAQTLQKIIKERHIQKAMCWDHPELENLKLEEVFSQEQAKLLRWPLGKNRDWLLQADIMDAGIVWGDIAMAETGTIVLPAASPGQPTSVCVLPLTLIAIFTTAQLVEGLASVMKIFKARYGVNLPTTTTFISGPSRTTDIEMVLTIGVHGSRYVYALILDES
jgi:L-lactate dehydrogenase complex protein LldG